MAKLSISGVQEAFASNGVTVNAAKNGNEVVFTAAGGRTVLKAPTKGASAVSTETPFIPVSRVRSAVAAYTS